MSTEASRKTSGMCLSQTLLSVGFDGNEAVVELGSLAVRSLFPLPMSFSSQSKRKTSNARFYSTDVMYNACSYHSEKNMEQSNLCETA